MQSKTSNLSQAHQTSNASSFKRTPVQMQNMLEAVRNVYVFETPL